MASGTCHVKARFTSKTKATAQVQFGWSDRGPISLVKSQICMTGSSAFSSRLAIGERSGRSSNGDWSRTRSGSLCPAKNPVIRLTRCPLRVYRASLQRTAIMPPMTRRFQFSLRQVLLSIAALAVYISLVSAIGGPGWRIVIVSPGVAATSSIAGLACITQGVRMADQSNEPRFSALLIVSIGICLVGAAMLAVISPLLLDSV